MCPPPSPPLTAAAARLTEFGYVVVRATASDPLRADQGLVDSWIMPGRSRVALSAGGRFRRELTPDGAQAVSQALSNAARLHGLDTDGLAFRPEGCYAIVNTPQATDSQGLHTDYPEHIVGHLRGTPRYPRSAIWAACSPFVLHLGGSDVRVPTGHVIFFMADFWHGGGRYLSGNPRFHGFQLAACTPIPTGVYN